MTSWFLSGFNWNAFDELEYRINKKRNPFDSLKLPCLKQTLILFGKLIPSSICHHMHIVLWHLSIVRQEIPRKKNRTRDERSHVRLQFFIQTKTTLQSDKRWLKSSSIFSPKKILSTIPVQLHNVDSTECQHAFLQFYKIAFTPISSFLFSRQDFITGISLVQPTHNYSALYMKEMSGGPLEFFFYRTSTGVSKLHSILQCNIIPLLIYYNFTQSPGILLPCYETPSVKMKKQRRPRNQLHISCTATSRQYGRWNVP